MPNVGLTSFDGTTKKTWDEIKAEIEAGGDLRWAYPGSPATVAWLLENSGERRDVDPEEVSASQIEKGIRLLWLEGITPYYMKPARMAASILGTMKHMYINQERKGYITETRLFGPTGSAKCDTLYVANGLLEDMKTIKWYAIRLMLENGVMQASPGYGLQVNLFRVLMKMPENQEILLKKYPWLKREDLQVKQMQLTCYPPDLTAMNRKEAEKLVTGDPDIIPVQVPFIDDDEVLETYARKKRELEDAYAIGYAPLCSEDERWERDGGFPVRCAKGYCPVVESCKQLSADAGETHPIEAWEAKRVEESARKAAEPAKRKRAAA